MKLEFETVDVFADQQFGGNPLAVIVDAQGLSAVQMQSIAAEFNLSETTFVLPPQTTEHTAQVRIFTPYAEMPFAGHPNVGTAFVLARRAECGHGLCSRPARRTTVLARRAEQQGRPIDGDVMIFEEVAGLVRMEIQREDSTVTGARLASPTALEIGDTVSTEIVAEACGLSVDDIDTEQHEPIIASCGAPFLVVAVKDQDALAAARPHVEVFESHLPRDQITGIHLYTRAILQEVDIQTRMFAPLHGVSEDPATGSANVALIGLLAHLQDDRTAAMDIRIGQGIKWAGRACSTPPPK